MKITFEGTPKELTVFLLAPDMLEALKEISKGDGEFDRDPLTHAQNCIENMKRIAKEAIGEVDSPVEVAKGGNDG